MFWAPYIFMSWLWHLLMIFILKYHLPQDFSQVQYKDIIYLCSHLINIIYILFSLPLMTYNGVLQIMISLFTLPWIQTNIFLLIDLNMFIFSSSHYEKHAMSSLIFPWTLQTQSIENIYFETFIFHEICIFFYFRTKPQILTIMFM